MERDFAQEGLTSPSEAVARQRCLGEGVKALDLETVKDFLRFHISTSRGKIVQQPTADSLNAFAEWFFAGFTRVRGTPTDAQDRSEVYHASTSLNIYLGVSYLTYPSVCERPSPQKASWSINDGRSICSPYKTSRASSSLFGLETT